MEFKVKSRYFSKYLVFSMLGSLASCMMLLNKRKERKEKKKVKELLFLIHLELEDLKELFLLVQISWSWL